MITTDIPYTVSVTGGSGFQKPALHDRLNVTTTAPQLPPAPAASASDQPQLGIQPGDQTLNDFQPYGANGQTSPITGRRSGETPPPATDTKVAGEEAKNGTTAAQTSGATADTQKNEDPQQQAEIANLKSTEEKVKAHEAAHKSAGGTMTGPISYSYTRGPDGKNYVTGGEVPIQISAGKTPQETISRMQQVIQAALAPADPSPQDRAVAAQAATLQQKARSDMSSPSGTQPQTPTGKVQESSGAATQQTSAEQPSTNGTAPAVRSLKTAPGNRSHAISVYA